MEDFCMEKTHVDWNDFGCHNSLNKSKSHSVIAIKYSIYLKNGFIQNISMFKERIFLGLIFLFCALYSFSQNNLSVTYQGVHGVANNLNICGDPDTVSVQINLEGGANAERSNIRASLDLFKGVEFIELVQGSNPAVSLVNSNNPNEPVFDLPNISPANPSVEILFAVRATCDFIDSLEANEQAFVLDQWQFQYRMGGINLTETDNSFEYRDAFHVPFFAVELEPRNDLAAVGECFNRTINVVNTSLNSYVNSLTYEIVQEIGVSIDDIMINGVSVPFSMNNINAFSNRITIELNSTNFQTNAAVSGGLGNGDGRFDNNEILEITEVLCLQSCTLPRSSEHIFSWGCDDRICNDTRIVDFVNIGSGTPFPQIQRINETDAGYCSSGSSTIEIRNDGAQVDLGFGAMFDVAAGIGLTGSFDLANNGYVITSMTIAGVNIPNFSTLNELGNNPIFANDPDGIGGLADIDGDGFFDDLPIGSSIEVAVTFDFDCALGSVISHPDSCFNNFSTSFNGRLTYSDFCQNRETRLYSSYYRPTHSNTGFENFTDPDAFLEGGAFYVYHNEDRGVRSFDYSCPSGGELYAKVVLPAGVTINLAETQLLKNEISPFNIAGSNQNGDTTEIIFNGALLNFLSGGYNLVLGLEADCSAELGATEFPLTFGYRCIDCACSHIWYCDELPGPWLHSTNPPCPENTLIDCPVGIQTTDFQVNRTTFGFTDIDYSIPYPEQNANRKVAIPCDSVEMSITSFVGDTPLDSDFGVIIEYDNTDNTDSLNEIFIFGEGVVEFMTRGTVHTCDVFPSDLNIIAIDGQKQMQFDFTRCLQTMGLTLQPNDSIRFKGDFYINPDGPVAFQFRRVPNFRAYGYISNNGTLEHCDQFGENFTIGKSNSIFDFPNNLDFPSGCEEGLLEYRLVTINNGFSDFFGDELRPSTKVDSVIFDFEPSIFNAFNNGIVEVFVPGHPVHGNDYFPIRPLSDFPDGRYVAIFDTLNYVPALNNVTSSVFNIRVRLTPTCRSPLGSDASNRFYKFNSKMTFVDRFYANFIGDGSCVNTRNEEIVQDIEYANPPLFNFSPASNANFILLGDTAIWRLQLCNEAVEADAGLTWFAIENPDNAIEVVSMSDITDPNNIQNLPVQEYGTNYFAFADGLKRSSGGNPFSETCNLIEVKALVQLCGTSLMTARAGWSCEPFREANWTPDLYEPCADVRFPISVSTRDPRLDAEVNFQNTIAADLCDTNTISIILKNVDLGTVFDLQTVLTLPPFGATLVPGSVEVAYPPGTSFQSALNDPVFQSADNRGINYLYDGFDDLNPYLMNEGLQGFNSLNPSDSNQVEIRYKFITDCDFLSGSLAFYSFQGTKGCNEPSNFEAGETLPIYINGVAPNPDKFFRIEFQPGTVLTSNFTTVEIVTTNLTNTPTDQNDKIRFVLPPGVSYQSGSSIGVVPSSWIPGEPDVQRINGVDILLWTLPSGLIIGEQAVLRLSLNTPVYACNDPVEMVKLSTVISTDLTCVSNNSTCEIFTINSENGDNFIDLPVGESLTISNLNLESYCAGGNQEAVHFDMELTSAGFSFSGQMVSLNFFADRNGNNIYDNGELVSSQLFSTPSSGNAWTVQDTVDFGVNDVCAIGIFISNDVLPLCDTFYSILPTPDLLNAGSDQVLCGNDIVLNADLGVNNCISNDYEFEWEAIFPANLSMVSDATIANPTVTLPNNAGIGTFEFILKTNRGNCFVTADTIALSIGDPILVSISSPQIIPIGGSVNLNPTVTGGSAPYTYSWNPIADLSNPNLQSPEASPSTDTQYTVTVTDANGCSEQASVLVEIFDPVVIDVNFTDTTICEETDLQILASGGTDFQWIPSPNNPTSGNLNDLNIFNPIFSNGVGQGVYEYELSVTNSAFPNNSNTITLTIRVAETPIANAGRDFYLCRGESVNLVGSASGGNSNFSYVWSGGLNGQSPTITPSNTTIHTLSVTDGNDCQSTDDVLVTVVDCPCDEAVVSNITIQNSSCGNRSGTAKIEITGNPRDYNFNWIPNIGNPISDLERTELPYGGYLIRITNTRDSDCSIDVPVVVANQNGPSANAMTTPATCDANDGTATLSPSNFIYEWQDGNRSDTRNDLSAGSYFVTLTDPNNLDCSNVLLVEVPQDNPLMADVVVNNQPDCGVRNGSVTLQVTGGSGNYSYSWPSGTSTQNGLGSGIHLVTITDNSTTSCEVPSIFVLTDNVPPGTVRISNTNNVTCRNGADGSVEFAVNYSAGFTQPADTIISNGYRTFQNGNLPVGDYCIEILDSNGCVAGGDCFRIELPDLAQVVANVTEDCGTGGKVELTVTGGVPPYTFDWSDLVGNNDPQNRIDLQQGLYMVNVIDAGGCITTANIEVGECGNCGIFTSNDTLIIQEPSCSSGGEICVPVDFATANQLEILDNGVKYTFPLQPCDIDSAILYSFANLYGQGFLGPYRIDSWIINGNSISGSFNSLADLELVLNQLDPGGNWVLQLASQSIIGGNDSNDYGLLVATDMNLGVRSEHPPVPTFLSNGYSILLDNGFHQVIIIDPLNGCSDTLLTNIVCTSPDTLRIELEVNESDTICIDGNELIGNVSNFYNNCPDGTFVDYVLLNDSCVIVTGELVGDELACLVVCDDQNICDTTFVIISVIPDPKPPKVITDTIGIGQVMTICCDTSELNLEGNIISMMNLCADSSGLMVDFDLDTINNCITYTGLDIGIDEACILFCDDLGFCDTANFVITVRDANVILDTIFLNFDTVRYCMDIDSLVIDSIYNDCPDLSGSEVVFSIDSSQICLTYYGIGIGVDTACIVLIDSFGIEHQTSFIVTVVTPQPEIICENIFPNQTIEFCPDTTEIGQNFTSIDNFCTNEGTGNVDFDPGTNCLEYTGLQLGRDTACIVACDDRGICDTTYLCITVRPFGDPPIAHIDCDTTDRNVVKILDVMQNDTIFGTAIQWPVIIDQPNGGRAETLPDGSVLYTQTEDFCDSEDFFTYQICNENGCDIDTVKIYVRCIDIVVFTAVSPNRDGVNDTFYIGGIEDKPDNNLKVFNRWGNLVFEQDNYQNKWEGTWDGNDLPDGTYFYIFKVTDQGRERIFRGYLDIFR